MGSRGKGLTRVRTRLETNLLPAVRLRFRPSAETGGRTVLRGAFTASYYRAPCRISFWLQSFPKWKRGNQQPGTGTREFHRQFPGRVPVRAAWTNFRPPFNAPVSTVRVFGRGPGPNAGPYGFRATTSMISRTLVEGLPCCRWLCRIERAPKAYSPYRGTSIAQNGRPVGVCSNGGPSKWPVSAVPPGIYQLKLPQTANYNALQTF